MGSAKHASIAGVNVIGGGEVSTPKCVDNYEQLRNVALPSSPSHSTHLSTCDYIFVAGLPDPRISRLQGFFEWRPHSLDADNGGTAIKPNALSAQSKGRWHRVFDGAISVHWFGAQGDGKHDDTPNIQAAIYAAAGQAISGGALYLPPGTYIVTPQKPDGGAQTVLDLPSNVTIYGDGAVSVIKVAANTGTYHAIFGSSKPLPAKIALRDLSINQNPAEVIGPVDPSLGHGQYVIFVVDCVDLTIDRCSFLHCGANAINVLGSAAQSVRITNSTFHFVATGQSSYDNSTLYLHCINHVVSGNVFTTPWPPTPTTFAGGAIETHKGPATVIGNIIDGFFAGMNVVSGDSLVTIPPDPADDPNDIIVSGNTLRRVNGGIHLWSTPGYALRNVSIVGNTIQINNNDWGDVFPGGNSTQGINFMLESMQSSGRHEGITISSNMIRFQSPAKPATGGGAPYTCGIGCSAAGPISDVLIANNAILDSPCKGIDISDILMAGIGVPALATSVRITGNLISNAGWDTTAGVSRAAICSIQRQLGNCLIDNNHISLDVSFPSPTAAYSVYIDTVAATSNLCIRDNRVTTPGGSSPEYNVVGSASVFGGGGATRPISPVKWETFFDATIAKAIWYDGSNWVDGNGNIV
jgi:hypothetical protein